MKKQVFAVCDLEAEFACNFMDYLNKKKNIPFEIQAFTNVESLVAYLRENPVELLLISADAMCDEIGELDIGKIVILTEGNKPSEFVDYSGVYKYQASSDIVREVMACYGAEKSILPVKSPILKRGTELIGVYSPIGGCLQTSFALTLAQIIGKDRSVLYLNLEEYSGFEESTQKKYTHTLSDLLYFAKQGDINLTAKMNGMIESMGSVDFIPPVQSPEDIRGSRWQDIERLLGEISIHSNYDTIIIDVGNGIDEVFQLLEMCKTVYVPTKKDDISKCKIREFENLLRIRGYTQVLTRLVRLKPLGDQIDIRFGIDTEQMIWSPLGDYIRQLLGKAGA